MSRMIGEAQRRFRRPASGASEYRLSTGTEVEDVREVVRLGARLYHLENCSDMKSPSERNTLRSDLYSGGRRLKARSLFIPPLNLWHQLMSMAVISPLSWMCF